MGSLGVYSFGQMADEVSRNVQDSSAAGRTKIKDALRRAYDTAASRYDWPQLHRQDELGLRKRDESGIKTLESGNGFFPMPWECYRVIDVTLTSPTGITLKQVSPEDLVRLAGSRYDETTRTPCCYAIVGQTAQHVPLAADSVLTVKSSASGNDGVRDARITYQTSTGQSGRTVDEVLQAGTFSTGVSTNAAAQAGWPVESLYLPPQWAGDVTVEDALANVIVDVEGTEAGGTSSTEWQVLSRPLARVWPIPSQDFGGVITYARRPRTMVRDTDTPELPISSALVALATAQFLRQARRPEESSYYEGEGQRALSSAQGGSSRPRLSIKPRGGILENNGISSNWVRRTYG